MGPLFFVPLSYQFETLTSFLKRICGTEPSEWECLVSKQGKSLPLYQRELIWTSSRLCKHSLTPARRPYPRQRPWLSPSSIIKDWFDHPTSTPSDPSPRKPSTNLNWCRFESALPKRTVQPVLVWCKSWSNSVLWSDREPSLLSGKDPNSRSGEKDSFS